MVPELIKPLVDDMWRSPFGRKMHIFSEIIAVGMCALWVLERWPISQFGFLFDVPLLSDSFFIICDLGLIIVAGCYSIISSLTHYICRRVIINATDEVKRKVSVLRWDVIDIVTGVFVLFYGAYFFEHILLFSRGISLNIVANTTVLFSLIWIIYNVGWRIHNSNKRFIKDMYSSSK